MRTQAALGRYPGAGQLTRCAVQPVERGRTVHSPQEWVLAYAVWQWWPPVPVHLRQGAHLTEIGVLAVLFLLGVVVSSLLAPVLCLFSSRRAGFLPVSLAPRVVRAWVGAGGSIHFSDAQTAAGLRQGRRYSPADRQGVHMCGSDHRRLVLGSSDAATTATDVTSG